MLWLIAGSLAAFFSALAEAQISGGQPNGACLCFSFTGVNVRDTPCGNVIGGANPPECYRHQGTNTVCNLGGINYEFYNFDYNGRTGWAAGDYFRVGSEADCSGGGGGCAGVEMVSRAAWGARPPAYTIGNIALPVCQLFVHHTVTPNCYDQAACSAAMRSIQNYHMDANGYPDIAYNQLIGEDGRWYEGRGWNKIGAHTLDYNYVSVAISVIGDFTNSLPNNAGLTALQNLIQCARDQNIVTSGFKLYGHRDANPTACPGNTLYPWVRDRPQYCLSPGPSFNTPCANCNSRP